MRFRELSELPRRPVLRREAIDFVLAVPGEQKRPLLNEPFLSFLPSL